MDFSVRKATLADVPALRILIAESTRKLHTSHYTPIQIEAALKYLYGVDTAIIIDGHYFVIDEPPSETSTPLSQPSDVEPKLIACGGWSNRKTLYGGDQYYAREDDILSPEKGDVAKIRAFFVHPEWARKGLGRLVLGACENAAREAGFTKAEMGATLAGVSFYERMGYSKLKGAKRIEVIGEDVEVELVRMKKDML